MKQLSTLSLLVCCLLFGKPIHAMENLKSLIVASYNGNMSDVKRFLPLVDDPNAYLGASQHGLSLPGDQKLTLNALSAAAFSGKNDLLNLLLHPVDLTLKKTIDVNAAAPNSNLTPVTYAIMGKNYNGLKALIDAGTNVKTVDNTKFKATPLMWAASLVDDDPRFVQLLLENGADPDKQNTEKATALYTAISKKHAEIAKVLIPVTNVTLANDKGNTPLHLVAVLGLTDLIKPLVDAGAKLDTKNNADLTPLELAQNREHLATVEALQRAEEEPVVENRLKQLIAAAWNGSDISALAREVDNINQTMKADELGIPENKEEVNALMAAAMRGHLETVKALIENHRANINIQNSEGYTTLMYVIIMAEKATGDLATNLFNVFNYLLTKNPHLNLQNRDHNQTVVHLAVMLPETKKEYLEALLKQEPAPNLTIEDTNNRTPEELAKHLGKSVFENMLKIEEPITPSGDNELIGNLSSLTSQLYALAKVLA